MKQLAIIITCFILASCWGGDSLQKNIACNNYRPQIVLKNEKNDAIFNKKGMGREIKKTDLDIFYSPKTNSCLYLIKEESFWHNSGYSALFVLEDYFSNELISTSEGGDKFSKTYTEAEQEIRAVILKYK